MERAVQQRSFLKKKTNALRLVNGSGDHLAGLVLEQYNRHFCLQVFDAGWLKREEEIAAFILKQFDL